MKKYLLWLRLLTKRQLNHHIMLIFLIALPICTLVISHMPQMHETSVPKVGLYLLDDDSISKSAVYDLVSHSSPVVSYYVADSIESLKNDIMTGKADCGYVFKDDLNKRLTTHRYKDAIIHLKSPSGTLSSLSNEMVFSSVFKAFGAEAAFDYIDSNEALVSVSTDAKAYARSRFDYYINGPATFHIEFKSMNTESGDITDSGKSYEHESSIYQPETLDDIQIDTSIFPLRGILAILIFVAGIFGSIQWLSDYEHCVFVSVSRSFIHVSRIMYAFIPAALFAASSALSILASRTYTNAAKEIPAMAVYILLVTGFSLAMSYIIHSSKTLISLLPMLILGSLIFCPVFINISEFMPFIAVIEKLFIPYYYLALF